MRAAARMTPETERRILALMRAHDVLTLTTLRADGRPQAATVAYANEGLTLYIAAPKDCHQARHIRRAKRVSITIVRNGADRRRLAGLLMAGAAEVLDDALTARHGLECLRNRFPAYAALLDPADLAEMDVIRVRPRIISLLDDEKEPGARIAP